MTDSNINYDEIIIDNTITYEILPIDINNENISITSPDKYPYTISVSENGATPLVYIKYNTLTLVKDIDYTLEYINNKEIGKATIKITGINNFTNVIEKTFVISNDPITITFIARSKDNSQTGNFDESYDKLIRVDSNDEAVATMKFYPNVESVTLPTAFKNGYSAKWLSIGRYFDFGEIVTPDELINYTTFEIETWDIITYEITYELNGGSFSNDNYETTYNVNQSFTLKIPTYNSVTFIGWYKEKEFINQVTEIELNSTGNLTLYAKWDIREYNIYYELDGGINSELNPDTLSNTTPLTLSDPTKPYYKFEGWYTDSNYLNKIEAINTISSDMTLYAKWEKISYNIRYESNIDKYDNPNIKTCDITTITINLADAKANGYLFMGWYNEEEHINLITKIDATDPSDTYAYAYFVLNRTTIKISLNGASTDQRNPFFARLETNIQDVFNYGSIVTATITVKNGYSFVGWYLNNELVTSTEILSNENKTITFSIDENTMQYEARFIEA